MSKSTLTITFSCGKPCTYKVPEGTLEAGQAELALHLPHYLRPITSVTLVNAEGVDLWATDAPKAKAPRKSRKAAPAPIAPVKPVALTRSAEYLQAVADLEAQGKGHVAARIVATGIARAARKAA